EEWLKIHNKTEDQIKEELRPNAEARARRGLVMRELSRAEKLDVSDQEIAAEVERQLSLFGQDNGRVRRALQREEARRSMQNSILSNKVLQRMVQIAQGAVDGEAGASLAAVDAASEETGQENLTSS
ncbi:MAG: hypothetical protein ACUVR3_04545, partial [Candidatus Roseilinea sp.]